MSKQGFTLKSVKPVILNRLNNSGWALCIGAGTSLPMFPDWVELVMLLAARDLAPSEAPQVLKSLHQKFSPDTLLQASKDRLGLDDDQFAALLSESLYKGIKSKLNNTDWDCFTSILSSWHIYHG